MKAYLIVCLLISTFITNTRQEQCGTPIECYTQAIELLKQDRNEMKRERDIFKKQLDEIQTLLSAKIGACEKTLAELSLNVEKSKTEIKSEISNSITATRNYINQPWTYISPVQLLKTNQLSTTVIAYPMVVPKNAKKVLIYARLSSGFANMSSEIDVKIGTKLNSNYGYQYLYCYTYNQNAISMNSQMFEFNVTDDFNLYVQSNLNSAISNFSLSIQIVAWNN